MLRLFEFLQWLLLILLLTFFFESFVGPQFALQELHKHLEVGEAKTLLVAGYTQYLSTGVSQQCVQLLAG